MDAELHIPDVAELDEVVDALTGWQSDALPMQLHPGDLGWFWQFGSDRMAGAPNYQLDIAAPCKPGDNPRYPPGGLRNLRDRGNQARMA